MAEYLREDGPDGVQRLLNAAHWDTEAVREDLRQYVVEQLSDPQAVLIADETAVYRPAAALAGELPASAWQRLSAGAGTKGARWYAWAWQPLWRVQMTAEERAWGHWLVVRRSLKDPHDLAYYVAFAPREGMPLSTLVKVIGRRWAIEAGFEATKQECGLDEYEVRTWQAWHRPITLSLLAHAFLVALQVQAKKGAADRVIPLTVPEIRRLLIERLWHTRSDAAQILAWSCWRRRHQARAMHCHYAKQEAQYTSKVRL